MPRTTKDLTADQLRLVLIMRDCQFGRIENMAIRTGQPMFDGDAKIVRVARLGARIDGTVALRTDEFELKHAVRDLFEELTRIQNGTVLRLEFRRGLPVLLEVVENN